MQLGLKISTILDSFCKITIYFDKLLLQNSDLEKYPMKCLHIKGMKFSISTVKSVKRATKPHCKVPSLEKLVDGILWHDPN